MQHSKYEEKNEEKNYHYVEILAKEIERIESKKFRVNIDSFTNFIVKLTEFLVPLVSLLKLLS